jgi:glutamyl-tRNA reductase
MYCEHILERFINVNGTTIMWDVQVITDGTLVANQPDRVLHDTKENTCLLIDIALPDDTNINTKETEKLSKYKDLEIEVSQIWKVRTKSVPVINAALGTIKKGLYQNLQLLPGQLSAIELQKFTLMSAAHSIVKCWGKSL